MIDYIEDFAHSKFLDNQRSEDRIFMRDHFCAVIDGATAKHTTEAGMANGGDVADMVCAALDELPANCAPGTLVKAVSGYVNAMLQGRTAGEDRPAAMLLVYSAVHRKVIRVGDSHASINGQVHKGAKRIDDLLSEIRSVFSQTYAPGRPGEDPGRELILPALRQQFRLQNNDALQDYGYGCIDGTEVPARFVETWDVPEGSEVVLCSDGYPTAAPSLAEAERGLREALAADPDCVGILKSTKGVKPGQVSFDDRSYVRFRTR